MREIFLTPAADRALNRMPANEARRIEAKIAQYAADPASLANNVKRLQGSHLLRLRVGDWRVLFADDGRVVAIVKIAPRGSAYGA